MHRSFFVFSLSSDIGIAVFTFPSLHSSRRTFFFLSLPPFLSGDSCVTERTACAAYPQREANLAYSGCHYRKSVPFFIVLVFFRRKKHTKTHRRIL